MSVIVEHTDKNIQENNTAVCIIVVLQYYNSVFSYMLYQYGLSSL